MEQAKQVQTEHKYPVIKGKVCRILPYSAKYIISGPTKSNKDEKAEDIQKSPSSDESDKENEVEVSALAEE